jgi:hypothetical protein
MNAKKVLEVLNEMQAARWADAKAFVEEAAASKPARRRATARLGIGEKFRILEELQEAYADIAAIGAAARRLARSRQEGAGEETGGISACPG